MKIIQGTCSKTGEFRLEKRAVFGLLLGGGLLLAQHLLAAAGMVDDELGVAGLVGGPGKQLLDVAVARGPGTEHDLLGSAHRRFGGCQGLDGLQHGRCGVGQAARSGPGE